jgi:hypothetical protein
MPPECHLTFPIENREMTRSTRMRAGRPRHPLASAAKAVPPIPLKKLIPIQRIWLASDRQRLEHQLDTMPVGQLAKGPKNEGSVAAARLSRPEAMDRDSILFRDDLHKSTASAVAADKRVRSLPHGSGHDPELSDEIRQRGAHEIIIKLKKWREQQASKCFPDSIRRSTV